MENDNLVLQAFLDLTSRKDYQFSSASEAEKVDREFQKLLPLIPKKYTPFFHYNEFRIANALILPKTRPRILMGGSFFSNFPNVHGYPLSEVADVVCLSCSNKPFPYKSTIHCTADLHFFDILQKLPSGFYPDFYWDNQVEQWHYIPAGIDMAPFPIIASVCHTYLHKSIEQVCELFDLVVANSKFHASLLRRKYPEKIIELPFGLNWGSFDFHIDPHWEKTIDVSLSFAESDSPFYCQKRNRVIEMTKQFKEKYKDCFNIEITHSLPREEYLDLLEKSAVVINVTGINGPYNYRTIEAICSGCCLLQYDWDKSDFFENKFSELFIEGEHGMGFTFENFEAKLLFCLENQYCLFVLCFLYGSIQRFRSLKL